MPQEEYMKKLNTILVICLFLWPMSCLTNDSVTTETRYYPSDSWRTSTPEAQGLDSTQLAKVFDLVKKKDIHIHSLLLIRNGYLVLEAYFYPNSKGIVHDVASVTKSITSILTGISIDKGLIKSLDQPVLDFFIDRKIANLTEYKKKLTIEHLLTMRTGLCRDYAHGEQQLDDTRKTDDWVQYMLDQPMLTEPGTEFAYCTGGTHLLSAVITRATGMNELTFARKYLFEPLGIHEVIWPADPQGNNTGGFDLHLHSIDMARIGYLFLNDGVWKGQQIISKEWVKKSTQIQVTLPDGERYGYLWWSPDENPDLIEARGRGGQRIIFSKEKNIVIVFTGSGFEPGQIGAIIVPALRTDQPLPENPSGYKLLKSQIEAAAKAPESKPVPKLPAVADEISGKTFVFEPNPLGIKSFTLSFGKGAEAKLILIEEDQSEENPIGLDGVYRFSNNSRFGTPEALKGSWISDKEFLLIYNEFANNHLWRISFHFAKGRASVRFVENTGLLNTSFSAKLEK